MTNYWRLVNEVIREADVLLLILDARFPKETRNAELESKIRRLDKKLIFVLNKSDMIGKEQARILKKNYSPCVFVAAARKLGGTVLMNKILEVSQGGSPLVGVLGYPNVGKSSVINLLKGRASAPVSSVAGHTRGLQVIKVRGKIRMIDTPGVLAYKETDMQKKIIIGAANPHQVKEPEIHAIRLLASYPELFSEYYGVEIKEDYDTLEMIALNKGILKKGGMPDTLRMATQILYDWQKGKVHKGKLEKEPKVLDSRIAKPL
jgi:hypothetical protein